MKFIFLGTPEFSAIILEKIIKTGLIPSLVICNPDKPKGRKKTLTPPPTKIIAQKYNIPIFQPDNLEFGIWNLPACRTSREFGKIKNEIFDFFLVAAYSKILPKKILDIPKLGCLNIHPSLLPRWRGPSPIQSAILNGDEKTGVSIILLDEKMDHGPIIAQQQLNNCELKIMSYEKLTKKLADLGANLLIKILPKFLDKKMKSQAQDESQAVYSKIITTNEGFIELEKLKEAIKNGGQVAAAIERKARALNPEPGIYAILNEKRIKILETELSDNKLKLIKIQPEGKNPMNADDFFRNRSEFKN